jgi:hypothetical protein
MSAVGMALFTLITPDGSYVVHILGPGILVTFALGLAFTPVTFAATAGVPMSQAGLASGVVNTTRVVGGSVGLGALATLAVDRTQSLLRAHPPVPPKIALTEGFSRAFLASVFLLVGAALAALIIPPVSPRPRAGQPAGAAVPEAADADRTARQA